MDNNLIFCKPLQNDRQVYGDEFLIKSDKVEFFSTYSDFKCFPNLILFKGGKSLTIYGFDVTVKLDDPLSKIIMISVEILRPERKPLVFRDLGLIKKDVESETFRNYESQFNLPEPEIFSFTKRERNYHIETKSVHEIMSSHLHSFRVIIETSKKIQEYIVPVLILPQKSFDEDKSLNIFKIDKNKKMELINFLNKIKRDSNLQENNKFHPIEPKIKLNIPYFPPSILLKIKQNAYSRAGSTEQNKRKLESNTFNEFESDRKQRKLAASLSFETIEPSINLSKKQQGVVDV